MRIKAVGATRFLRQSPRQPPQPAHFDSLAEPGYDGMHITVIAKRANRREPNMMELLVRRARRLIDSWMDRPAAERVAEEAAPTPSGDYRPLKRLLLTDGVGRTLFDEFADHRASPRGEEETGWLLLGPAARATTPSPWRRCRPAPSAKPAWRTCGFTAAAQAVGSRIVRQSDRRLTILGVVHTHPGSLRHPSYGDYDGDRRWVRQLRGREGVFGIGTADASGGRRCSPRSRSRTCRCLGKLRFSWYALAEGDSAYRPLPVMLTLGPDLARDLHPVWPALEAHAERLERLARQQARVRFEVTPQRQLMADAAAGRTGRRAAGLARRERRFRTIW